MDRRLAYPISCLQHADERQACLKSKVRSMLRLVAVSRDDKTLLSRGCTGSYGDLICVKNDLQNAEHTHDAIFSSDSETVRVQTPPLFATISVNEADKLDEETRSNCVAILNTEHLAKPCFSSNEFQIVVTIDASTTKGSKQASICFERTSKQDMILLISSASGLRRRISSGKLPELKLDEFFNPKQNIGDSILTFSHPNRSILPESLRRTLASFIEKRLRLHCLISASTKSERRVCLDKAYMPNATNADRHLAVLQATLHASAASCICAAHQLPTQSNGVVKITMKTCGRSLRNCEGRKFCPLHDSSESRFNLLGKCCECTEATVVCSHQNVDTRSGLRMKCALNREDSMDLARILINALKYKNAEVDDVEAQEFEASTDLTKHDRAAIALMEKGVVLKKYASGKKKDFVYLHLKGAKFKTSERNIVCTHGHLFKKA